MDNNTRDANRAKDRSTEVVDGYRWTFSEWDGVFQIHCQRLCGGLPGREYFTFVGKSLKFATAEGRDYFVKAMSASGWVKSRQAGRAA